MQDATYGIIYLGDHPANLRVKKTFIQALKIALKSQAENWLYVYSKFSFTAIYNLQL